MVVATFDYGGGGDNPAVQAWWYQYHGGDKHGGTMVPVEAWWYHGSS